MSKIVTMYAGDQERIRNVGSILTLASDMLDGIHDNGMNKGKEVIGECIEQIENVKRMLNQLASKAVTHQTPPGRMQP